MTDETTNDIVNLTDNHGKEVPFEIVKIIVYENEQYAIMHPLKHFDGLEEDSCVILKLNEIDEDNVELIPVSDEDILDTVYALYVEWATNVEEQGCEGNCNGCSGCH